ncbi:unnamed protein product [Brachionus calyciflorus]|uniref:dTMP kinase n=1 Tax=Brachionus calyciflorus TaxID=104777 RepID=A0A813ZMF3_9BILA|nr:unnamed protein product [Brachionus calyciflorus]
MIKNMTQRGLLIVFEGLDRSGKTTQAKLLSDALNKLEDHAVHLLFSANRWETVKEMKEKLNLGINLIVDRYAYSGVAYTSAKTGFDFNWCKQCDVGLPKPDLVCFMDTKIDDLEKRKNFGEERYETTEFQKLVYANFKKMFDLENNSKDCLVLNAKDSIENLHSDILKNTLELVKSNQFSMNEFKFLW